MRKWNPILYEWSDTYAYTFQLGNQKLVHFYGSACGMLTGLCGIKSLKEEYAASTLIFRPTTENMSTS